MLIHVKNRHSLENRRISLCTTSGFGGVEGRWRGLIGAWLVDCPLLRPSVTLESLVSVSRAEHGAFLFFVLQSRSRARQIEQDGLRHVGRGASGLGKE